MALQVFNEPSACPLGELEFLDAAALAATPAVIAAVDRMGLKPTEFSDTVARLAFQVANAMRIERSLMHQAIDPASTRLRR